MVRPDAAALLRRCDHRLYVDFTTAQHGALSILATRTDTEIDASTADEIVGAMERLPPYPEVGEALDRLQLGPQPDAVGVDLTELAEEILARDAA